MGFKEFMVANHLSVRFLLDLCDSPFLPLQSSGKERDKLRWQFLIYDKDGSGSLTRDEMTSMFLMMYQDPDLDKAEQKIAAREITGKAEEMFSKLDADGEQSFLETSQITSETRFEVEGGEGKQVEFGLVLVVCNSKCEEAVTEDDLVN